MSGNFLFTWLALSVLGLISIFGSSAVVFKKYYWRPTYEQWVKYVVVSETRSFVRARRRIRR